MDIEETNETTKLKHIVLREDLEQQQIIVYAKNYNWNRLYKSIFMILSFYTFLLLVLASEPKYDSQFLNLNCINNCESEFCDNRFTFCDYLPVEEDWSKEHELSFNEKLYRISSGVGLFYKSWHDSASILTWILYTFFLYFTTTVIVINYIMFYYENKRLA